MDVRPNGSRDIAFQGSNRQIVVGVVFLVVMLSGVFFNSLVIHVFRKSKHLQTPLNVLVIGCSIIDITMLLVGLPFLIASSFYGYWVFGSAWCEGYGFVMTLMGVSSICILSAIALDRYLIVTQRPFARKITTFKAVMTIFSCLGYGLLWATFPLVGWGSYVLEPCMLVCGPDWSNPALSQRSYNIVILTLVFGVPITTIAYCYTQIVITIKKKLISPDNASASVRQREIHVACSVFFAILSFLVAWLPYACMSIWSMYNDASKLPQTLTLFVPLLAKSASAWNPLIYAIRSKEYRHEIKKIVFQRCRRRAIASQDVELSVQHSHSVVTTSVLALRPKYVTPKHPESHINHFTMSTIFEEKLSRQPKKTSEISINSPGCSGD